MCQHGETRTRNIIVGGQTVTKKEIYCVVHGWFDLLLVSEFDFRRQHRNCYQPKAGSFVSSITPKVMKQAA